MGEKIDKSPFLFEKSPPHLSLLVQKHRRSSCCGHGLTRTTYTLAGAGTVTKVNANGTYAIKYDPGYSYSKVLGSDMLLVDDTMFDDRGGRKGGKKGGKKKKKK